MKIAGMLLLGAALAAPAGAVTPSLGQTVQPGQWEVTARIDTVDAPSAPPMIAKMMQGRKTTLRYCVTPEQAAQGPQEMLKGNKSCAVTRYSASGGRLSSEMVCKQAGTTMTSMSSGTYTPTSFVATGRSVTSGTQAMTVTTTSTGHRLGDCQ